MKDNSNLSLGAVAVLVAIAVLIFSLASYTNPLLWAGVGVFAIFILFYLQPLIGIFLIAALYPFTQLQFIYGSINVPYSDLAGAILFGVFALKMLVKIFRGQWKFSKLDYPALLPFLGFVLAGALSLINVEGSIIASVKYLLRPIIFFYAIYIILPIQFIKTPRVMLRVMKTILAMGGVMALGGLYMLVISDLSFPARRALPFGYGSFFPLGTNHNALAEVLVGVLPVALAFFWLEKDIFKRNLYLALAGFIGAVAFLTFSRAGWLGLMAVIIASVYLRFKEVIHQKYLKPALAILGLSVIPLAILLYLLSTTQLVQGSNLNRLKLVDISISLFLKHPIIGNGVGTFFGEVEQIKAYIIEYGSALDAHGIFFKVMAEMGAIGLFFIILFVGVLFYRMYKNYWLIKSEECSIMAAAFIASSLGMFVFELFNTSYYLGKLWFFFGLAFATFKICSDKYESQD